MSQHMEASLRALCFFYRHPPAGSGVRPQPDKKIAKSLPCAASAPSRLFTRAFVGRSAWRRENRGAHRVCMFIQPPTNDNLSKLRLHMLRAGFAWWGSRGGSAGVPRGFRGGSVVVSGGSVGVPGGSGGLRAQIGVSGRSLGAWQCTDSIVVFSRVSHVFGMSRRRSWPRSAHPWGLRAHWKRWTCSLFLKLKKVEI